MIKGAFKLARITSSLLMLKASLQNPFVLRQLEILLNKLINDQPQLQSHLDGLQERFLNIQVHGLNLDWHVSASGQQLFINPGLHPEGVCTIHVHTSQMPGAFIKGNQNRYINVEGDFVTALHLQGLFQNLNFKIYPLLIKTIGQIPATAVVQTSTAISEHLSLMKEKVTDYAVTAMNNR